MADGPVLDALNAARRMLADCYWWRRIADADSPWDQATALAHIHFDGLPPADPGPNHSLAQMTALRPFAIMWTDITGGLRIRNATAGYTCNVPSGRIIAQIELPVPTAIASDPTAVADDISRKIGLILRTGDSDQPGLFELAGRSGYLPLTEVELFGYARTDAKAAEDLGDIVFAELQISWGLE